jgi:hypothetical protein
MDMRLLTLPAIAVLILAGAISHAAGAATTQSLDVKPIYRARSRA